MLSQLDQSCLRNPGIGEEDVLAFLRIGEKIPLRVPTEARWLVVFVLVLAFLANPAFFPYFDVLEKVEAREQLAKEHS